MDNFNLKSFLFENKMGMYSRAEGMSGDNVTDLGVGQAEADMEMQDGTLDEGQSGTTTATVEEYTPMILGKEYLINGSAEVEYSEEAADYEDQQMISAGGFTVDKAVLTIAELFVEEGTTSYRQIQDPKFIKQIQDLINTDPKLSADFEKECQDYFVNWDQLSERQSNDEQIGIGYAMKVKDSDPQQKDF